MLDNIRDEKDFDSVRRDNESMVIIGSKRTIEMRREQLRTVDIVRQGTNSGSVPHMAKIQ